MGNPKLATCPQRKKHTPCPDRYSAWRAWADEKMRTHRPVRCPGCGLFARWVRRSPRAMREERVS